MFEASKKLGDEDEDEDGKPSIAVLFGTGGKKKHAYNPGAKLGDNEESSEMGEDAEGRFTEACEIMAKMINAGRVDSGKLGQCLREAFKALEEEPHVEGEHTNEKGEG